MLTEGPNPSTPAAKLHLDSWIETVKVPYSTFRDPDDAPFIIRDEVAGKHTGFILERATRKIVFVGPETTALAKLETLP